MSIKNLSFKVSRTAHFSTYGELSKETKYIWFFMHGYGQLSKKTIQKFDFLDDKEHFVVAPEGLSRFYWHGNNEPVASWMTREDRYDEIDDFVNYLDSLYERYAGHVNQEVKMIVMGFSQGCATAWRWIHARQPKIDVLINWAGWIPEDISYIHLNDYLKDKDIFLCYGDQDAFISDKVMEGIRDVISINGLKIKIEQFTGAHRIPTDVFDKFTRENIIQT